ncbi:MAG: hypothetical protein CVU38_07790 [Chloroflexi bacterium HGW-Chloroflexi-1]|nr:MAG: hypothetical protein CVU38_07790 [Chloroflexi bacterium HGW-Chloroflexi-1]
MNSFTRRWRALLLALLLLALAASCMPVTSLDGPIPPTAAPAPRPTPAEPLALTLLHTNDTWGYLSPCG